MDYKKVVVELDGKRYALVPLEPPASQTPLDVCDSLPGIARNALKAAGIEYLESALTMTEAEFLRIPAFGRKGLAAIREELERRGWRIGQFRHEP